MLGNSGIYAAKKRKKPVLKHKKPPEANGVVKSNPSKRHRDRLNGELERLTELLPFPEDVRSRLDKLSVLRLSVGYLRVKSYFKATMKNGSVHHAGENRLGLYGKDGDSDIAGFSEVDLLLQALNGFVIVVASEGLVTYVSHTIKDYLGFNQSDVIHQSAFELIHTDDRALFRQQLHFAFNPTDSAGGVLQSCGESLQYKTEQLPPENSSFLERSFICRFRCLLDNSSGFLALKFQGRLKYLHGQSVLSDSGTRLQPQLALFAIAVPIQPPSIVEIRSKIMVFQTKHKLDFTPLGIDSRGKIVLGYSDMELCMNGSGYQFIHAADMMHCANKHMQMIKTGETGMTVFRLLSKSSGWVWVQSNAKLIYKDGRPDFIIARQRVLINTEGEDHLRQRSLQLPFSFATGEAVLYNNGPTMDIAQFEFKETFSTSETLKDVSPNSLLGCFLRQDQTIYTQTAAPSPEEHLFLESHALVNVPSDPWQAVDSTVLSGESVIVKEEAKESVMAVIGSLEKMMQNGDMCAALQNLEVDPAELMEWENVLRSSQDKRDDSFRSELDSLLTNDIFAYMDAVLFKENGSSNLNVNLPSCLTAGTNNQGEIFSPAAGLSEPQLFQRPVNNNSPLSAVQSFTEAPQTFSSTQKLSHYGPLPQPETSLPPIQQLQLQDIFSPSIELPELVLLDASANEASVPFEPCGQTSIGLMGSAPSSQLPQCPQSSTQLPNMGLHPLPSLISSHDFNSSSSHSAPLHFSSACLQGSTQTPQVHNHTLPPAGILQNGHQLTPAHQTTCSQKFPPDILWPARVNVQQEGVAGGPQAPPTSFLPGPTGGVVLSHSCQSGKEALVDTSPPQASGYFQWGHSEPVVGTSAINQDNVNISPQGEPVQANVSNVSNVSNMSNMQHYEECNRQTQNDRVPAESKGYFAIPALSDVAVYFSE